MVHFGLDGTPLRQTCLRVWVNTNLQLTSSLMRTAVARPIPRTCISVVLVAGIFRPPTLNTPPAGEPPRNVASASSGTPFPLATVTPRYPPLARDSGIVLIEVRVDTGGGVADAKVIRSARPFDKPALDAARRWTFRPARVRGTSVVTLAYIAFAFRQPVTVIPRSGSE